MIAHTEAQEGRPLRTTEEIAASYDAQAEESFRKKLENPFFERYGRAVGRMLATLKPTSMLDAGCGDGVTLNYALMEMPFVSVVAIDASEKRLQIASRILPSYRVALFSYPMQSMYLMDEAVDLVFTSHAIEPNGGREPEILRELYRVARRYLVLFEPDYDAAQPEGKARMERLGYCTHLHETIQHLGLPLVKHEPFSEIGSPLNPTSVWMLEKRA